MGYRSHVSAAITAPSREFFVSMIAELKLLNKLEANDPMFDKKGTTDWDFFKFVTLYDVTAPVWERVRIDGTVREARHIPLVVMEFVTEDDLKWYDGYDFPTLWENMTKIAERHGLSWQLCRIGEDADDVENECGFDSEPLEDYLRLLGLLTGTTEEQEELYKCYESAIEDGQNAFRLVTHVEDNEMFSIKGESSMKDLLLNKSRGNADESNN